jgi:hypothetical protein
MSVQAIPRRGADGSGVTHIVVEVGGEGLDFAQVGGRFTSRLEFGLLTLDSLARRRHVQPAAIDLSLSAEQTRQTQSTSVRWVSTLDMAPGRYSLRVAGHAVGAKTAGSVFLDIDMPKFDEEKLWIGGIALTSEVASRALTAGVSSAELNLPTPPTTARTFVKGDVVTLSAGVHTPANFTTGLLQLTVHPQSSPSGPALLDRTIDLPSRDAAHQPRAWVLDTSVLTPGAFVLRLTLRDAGGRWANTAVLFDIVEPGDTQRTP